MKVFFVALAFLLSTAGVTSLSAQTLPTLPPITSPATNTYLPGKFIWFDLATPDLRGLRNFYKNVFGWSFKKPTPSDDAYTLIYNQNRAIGGMFESVPPGGEQDGATWIVLMSVQDPAKAANAAKANGGKVEAPVVKLPGRGSHALLRDPAGALFGVMRSSSGDPLDAEVPIGDFFWVDLFTLNPLELKSFYTAMAPYEAETKTVLDDVDRILLRSNGQLRAGFVEVDKEANRSAWVPYVRVADVDMTLQKAIDGGGFAIIQPDPDLLDGKLAVFVDPNGGVMGIVEWEYDQENQQ